MNANMEWRMRLDRDYHKLPAPMTLTPQRMAGLRLLAAQLAAGYESGRDQLELSDLTGIPTREWTSYILGKAEMPLAKLHYVAGKFGVSPDYLLGCADYFGRRLELGDGKLYLPPWMMLRDERIFSNAVFLRTMTRLSTGPLPKEALAEMMNDRSVSDVGSMLSILPGSSTRSGNASFYTPAPYQPVATRLEMLCLRYHLIHKHGVDAAACLPELGNDFSDVEKAAAAKSLSKRQAAVKNHKPAVEPILARRLREMRAFSRDRFELPQSWEAVMASLDEVVNTQSLVLNHLGNVPDIPVRANLHRLLGLRQIPLENLVNAIMADQGVRVLLEMDAAQLLTKLKPRPVSTGYLPVALLVALAAQLGVSWRQLLPAR